MSIDLTETASTQLLARVGTARFAHHVIEFATQLPAALGPMAGAVNIEVTDGDGGSWLGLSIDIEHGDWLVGEDTMGAEIELVRLAHEAGLSSGIYFCEITPV